MKKIAKDGGRKSIEYGIWTFQRTSQNVLLSSGSGSTCKAQGVGVKDYIKQPGVSVYYTLFHAVTLLELLES